MITPVDRHDVGDSAGAVVAHVRQMIDRGALGPGARLPAERDLARQVGVSPPTLRAGPRTPAAPGGGRSPRGSRPSIPPGPPTPRTGGPCFLAPTRIGTSTRRCAPGMRTARGA